MLTPKTLNTDSLPFSSRFNREIKADKEKQILDIFRKVEISVPLLDALTQTPRYAKFRKDLCTNKRKLRGNEGVVMGDNFLFCCCFFHVILSLIVFLFFIFLF